MWQLFTFAARQYPFDWFGGVAGLVASMTGFVEDLPQEWQEKWDDLNREKSMTLDGKSDMNTSTLL